MGDRFSARSLHTAHDPGPPCHAARQLLRSGVVRQRYGGRQRGLLPLVRVVPRQRSAPHSARSGRIRLFLDLRHILRLLALQRTPRTHSRLRGDALHRRDVCGGKSFQRRRHKSHLRRTALLCRVHSHLGAHQHSRPPQHRRRHNYKRGDSRDRRLPLLPLHSPCRHAEMARASLPVHRRERQSVPLLRSE